MSRRQFILCLALFAIIVVAGTAAIRLWRQQERAATARAALPPLPNLTHWPEAMAADLQETVAAVRAAQEPREPLSRLAALFLMNGFEAEAMRTLGALQKIYPEDARWSYLLTDLHLRRGDKPAAERALEATVALDPMYAPAWIRLGDMRLERREIAGAEECYLQAAMNAPGDVRATFALIVFEAQHGQRTDPRRHLEQLARDFPGIVELHDLLARLHAAAGDPVQAAQERRLAAKSRRHLGTEDPWRDELMKFCYDPDRLQRLAGRLAREQRLVEAEKLLKRAVRLAPDESAPRRALARFFEENGRVLEARRLLEEAVVECPDDPELPVLLARVLGLEHKPFDAAATMRAALQRWPQRGELHAALGRALRDAHEPTEAVTALREAIRLDPTQVEACYDLGFCLVGLGQREEGRALAEQARVMRPDYPEALLLLGRLALENGELEFAENLVMKLHGLQPDEPGSQLLFGALHLAKGDRAQKAGDLAEAARLYDAGLEVSPQFAPLLHEAALLATRRAEYLPAVTFLERYLQLEPKDLEAYGMLATSYREIAQPDLIERTLERGMEMARKLGQPAKAAEFDAEIERLYAH